MPQGDLRKCDTQAKWKLYAISIGFAIIMATQANLISLQTSIEVKNARGSTTALIYTAMTVVTSSLYVPVVSLVGRKVCLVAGDVLVVLFTVSSLTHETWVIMAAATLMGFGDSLILAAAGAIISSLPRNQGDGDGNAKGGSNIGVFLAIFGLGQAGASIMPELILRDSNTQWKKINMSFLPDRFVNISNCGANDCPMNYAFKNHSAVFGNMIPTECSLRVYLLVIMGAQFIGIILHIIATPSDVKCCKRNSESGRLLKAKESGPIEIMKKSMTKLKQHLLSKLCWLTLPIQFQYGFYCGFIWSELGRAYVSCVIGVEHLGMVLFILYITSFITNILCNKFERTHSKPALFLTSFAFEATAYLSAFFWQPSTSSLYVPYILSVLLGVVHCLRRLSAYIIASDYFDDQDSSFLALTAVAALGNAVAFVWTNIMCVYAKLYILGSMSVLATVLAIVGHYCFRNVQSNPAITDS